MRSLQALIFLLAFVAAQNFQGDISDIRTHKCKAPNYSGHDTGYSILTAAGAGTVFTMFALLAFGGYLHVKRPEWKIPVVHWHLKDLEVPSFVLALLCFVIGVPMLVTGGYYLRWNRVYDVSGGCEELMQVTAESPLPFESLFTPVNMTIAYLGNSGAVEDSLLVLQMLVDEGVEAVVHTGNFDMCDDSALFREQLDRVLGNIPFIPVVGNNDLHVWGDYEEVLSERFNTSNYLQCEGTLFVNYWCMYRGLFLAFSSVGTKCGDGYSDYTWHEDQLREQLELSRPENLGATWVTCAWHKNQHDLQVGNMGDETGYEMYRICADYDTLTVTSNDFHYARSHALDGFDPQVVTETCVNTACTYDLTNDTIVVVSGLGGFKVDEELNDDRAEDEIWAHTYEGTAGAFICKYNYNGNPRFAYCYFKTIDGEVHDDFVYTRGPFP